MMLFFYSLKSIASSLFAFKFNIKYKCLVFNGWSPLKFLALLFSTNAEIPKQYELAGATTTHLFAVRKYEGSVYELDAILKSID